MKFRKAVSGLLAAVVMLPALRTVSISEGSFEISSAAAAREAAATYEQSGLYSFAYEEAGKYTSIVKDLYEAGEADAAELDLARAWQDCMELSPELYLSQDNGGDIYFGGDGYCVPGVSACKLAVPFGAASVSDFISLIPRSADELCVLVSLQPICGEKMLRSIGFGKKDDELISELKLISRIEGQVYLSFSPSPDLRPGTRTLVSSFISAYRRVSDLAERYAPGVKMVYTVSDVRLAGGNIFGTFYPGDSYVDIIGIDLQNTYNRSEVSSIQAAFDCRGVYYDLLTSVKRVLSDAESVTGRDDIPVIIESCSFPWDGTASIEDYTGAMRRFYSYLPAVCPGLKAVFYSNISSAAGLCNLRQNEAAAAMYAECSAFPWYINYSDSGNGRGVSEWSDICSVTSIDGGKTTRLHAFCCGIYSDSECRIFLDGVEIGEGEVLFTEGEHSLTLYTMLHGIRASRTDYAITLTETGGFKCSVVTPDSDFNNNGMLDSGDTEFLLAALAGWDLDIPYNTDVNNDGKTDMTDVIALNARMIPKQ